MCAATIGRYGELPPSPDYLLDNTVYPVDADAKQYELKYNSSVLFVLETLAKGKIAIIKHADNSDIHIEMPEAGTEFSVCLEKSGSYDAAKAPSATIPFVMKTSTPKQRLFPMSYIPFIR